MTVVFMCVAEFSKKREEKAHDIHRLSHNLLCTAGQKAMNPNLNIVKIKHFPNFQHLVLRVKQSHDTVRHDMKVTIMIRYNIIAVIF